MKLEHLLQAEQEAKRFLCRLKQVKDSEINKEVFDKNNFNNTTSSKETGALKRSSLDLTRCLARLRNDTY